MRKSDTILTADTCPLFRGLSAAQMEQALAFFRSKECSYARGEVLKAADESKLDFFGYVLSGHIQVSMDDLEGNRMIMASVEPGSFFGESLCLLKRETPLYIVATSEARILKMNTEGVEENLSHKGNTSEKLLKKLENELTLRFTAMLAEKNLTMNDRIQVLSKLSIREKILAFLSQQKRNAGIETGTIEISMNREDMASYLGVNCSALSRELGRMRDEGILEFYKSTFKI